MVTDGTGPYTRAEHYLEASRILIPEGVEGPCSYGCPHTGCAHELAALLRAGAHATLAAAAQEVEDEAITLDEAQEATRRRAIVERERAALREAEPHEGH